jgi:hypothetical protein
MAARRVFVLWLVLSLLAATTAALASAKPTPTAGGANQVSAVSGTLGQELWNGILRFKLVEVRDATPADHPSFTPGANQRLMVITAIIKNGTTGTWGELVSYTLADKDEVSYEIPMHFFTPVSLTIQQGAAARQTAIVPVDNSLVPVKLIFTCATCGPKFEAFRVTIPAPPSP